jgi:hypothetical protein
MQALQERRQIKMQASQERQASLRAQAFQERRHFKSAAIKSARHQEHSTSRAQITSRAQAVQERKHFSAERKQVIPGNFKSAAGTSWAQASKSSRHLKSTRRQARQERRALQERRHFKSTGKINVSRSRI